MTIARIQSFVFSGIDANPVEVQVQISPGLRVFLIVGLADKAAGESRERVRAARTITANVSRRAPKITDC